MKTKFTLLVALVAVFLPVFAEAGDRRCRSSRSYDSRHCRPQYSYNCQPRYQYHHQPQYSYSRPRYHNYNQSTYRAPIFQTPQFRYGGPREAQGQQVPHGYGSHYRPAVSFFNY
jgi:hypothetical protein